jgi:hypothetical protein
MEKMEREQPGTPGATPVSTPEPPEKRTPRWLGVVVAVVVVVFGAAILTPSPDDNARAERAVKPFQRLAAALSAHVSYDDYSRMVRDCRHAYDSYDPGEADRTVAIAAYLRLALDYYGAANEAWLAHRDSAFTGALATSYYWQAKYGDWRPESPWNNLASRPSADDVRRFAWHYAAACVREAVRRLG